MLQLYQHLASYKDDGRYVRVFGRPFQRTWRIMAPFSDILLYYIPNSAIETHPSTHATLHAFTNNLRPQPPHNSVRRNSSVDEASRQARGVVRSRAG